jgi:hypothetical protein
MINLKNITVDQEMINNFSKIYKLKKVVRTLVISLPIRENQSMVILLQRGENQST